MSSERKELTINRDNIVTEVLDAYRCQPDLQCFELEVKFTESHLALDMSGLTREMFTQFFLRLFDSHWDGHLDKVPAMNDQHLFNGTFEVIGRVLSHAMVLVDYFPISISVAALSMLTSGTCDDAMTTASFVRYLGEEDGAFVQECLGNPSILVGASKFKLMRILSTNGCSKMPTKDNCQELILSVARLCLLAKPLYPLSVLWSGMTTYPALWQGVTPAVLQQLYDELRPSAEKVVSSITYEYSDDTDYRFLEELVTGHLERYIMQLSVRRLTKLLTFWTAADCLGQPLLVQFNSLEGEQLRPMATTCTYTLGLSRCYLSYQALADNFDRHMDSVYTQTFDTV
jgi:hypothetical protein